MIRKPKTAKPTFQSYVRENGGLFGSRGGADKADVTQKRPYLEPTLIPGEVPVAQTQTGHKLTPYSKNKQGILGAICVTNFKLHFLPYDDHSIAAEDVHSRRHKLLGEEDVVLSAVDAVYQVSGGRRKRLTPTSGLSGHVKTLEIHCKDFRVHRFSFKITPKEECKKVVTAIVHHAFPTRLELLFAFECKGKPAVDESTPVPKFDCKADWEAELTRLNVIGYRTVVLNKEFTQCPSLPAVVVVPSNLTEAFIAHIAPQFIEYRWPVWSYTYAGLGSLVRFSYLIPETLEKDLDDKMENAVRMGHPKEEPAKVIDLQKELPSIKEIQASFCKVRDLCMPVSLKELWSSDHGWYSSLDSTRWLHIVAAALRAALDVTDFLVQGKSVIIKEADSRDLCPLVAALAQLLLDPHFRTLHGFQTLIEKEWVALGHPFTDRLGLVPGADGQECPTFLLFLDCVWQLTQQFPSAFQFSETYLTCVWDSVCLGLFDSFIFNSARLRVHSARRFSVYNNSAPLTILSAWEWSLQYNKEERSLFYNPLYLARSDLDVAALRRRPPFPADNPRLMLRRIYTRLLTETWEAVPVEASPVLRPVVSPPRLHFWEHCYLRWLGPLLLVGGGSPAMYLHQCVLVEEIVCLKHQLRSLKTATPFDKASRPRSELIFSHPASGAPPPATCSKWRGAVTSSFPYTPTQAGPSVLLNTPGLSMFAKNSFILDLDDEDDEEEDSTDELESSVDSGAGSTPLEGAAPPPSTASSSQAAKDSGFEATEPKDSEASEPSALLSDH